MLPIRKRIAALIALVPLALVFAPGAAQAEKRIALVVGNAGYQAGSLNTPANDAGLIAQTLQAAGFDVVGARDLDQDSMRHAFRDFLEKATGAGADTVAFVYVSGYGLQLEGENYFVPVDGRIARDSDIPAEALRISDYTRPLAALKLKASIVVLDAARANPFAKSGPPLAGGLALVEPEPGLLIAFNAAPGTVAPEGQGPYGPYAQALAEMIREGGLPLTGVFDRTRLRVNDMTQGAEVPWHSSKVQTSLVFFERAADAPPPAVSVEETAAIRSRPIRDLGAQDAYILALERDTIEGYSDFLAAYPDEPMAKRVRAIIAARREAMTWRRTRVVDTPPAYWSYLRRYPDGPHAGDAHRRLAYLAAAFEPPPTFAVMDYDVPPPPPEEIVYISQPVLVFSDPIFAFALPPPLPVVFLAPPPFEFVVLAPPPPPIGFFVLPCPVYLPVPIWVSPPAYVAPPPANNIIYNNIHNTVVVNNVTNAVTVTNPSGKTTTIQPGQTVAPAAAPGRGGPGVAPAPGLAAGIGPALPPSVAQKAVLLQNQPPQGTVAKPGGTAPANKQVPGQPGQPLPGMQGQPLPAAKGVVVPKPSPSAAITPSTPPAGTGKPPATTTVTPLTPATGGTEPATAPPGTRPAARPTQSPAAKLTAPSIAPKPVAPSPTVAKPAAPPPPRPAAMVKPPPPPPPPPARVVAPPPPRAAPAPAAATARAAPAAAPKGCPPGQPACKK
jgi:uncharacterized caspase-like protein